MSKADSFYAEGALRPGRGIYIDRPADNDLLQNCLGGKYTSILAARQSGKSSLKVRTSMRLAEQGVHSVSLNLNTIGRFVPMEQFYEALLEMISEQLHTYPDFSRAWNRHRGLPPTFRFFRILRRYALNMLDEDLLIFIDEIDITLSHSYSDDFFAAIRACHEDRPKFPELDRLAFILIGAAHPSDLMKDERHTPFNIASRLDLTDFSLEESLPFAEALSVPADRYLEVMDWILQWTGGHPYLTQALCRFLALEDKALTDEQVVRNAVQSVFLDPGVKDYHLEFVRRTVLREPNAVPALRMYSQICTDHAVTDDELIDTVSQLKLAGIVTSDSGILKIRNRVYEDKFNLEWIQRELANRGDYSAIGADLNGAAERPSEATASRKHPFRQSPQPSRWRILKTTESGRGDGINQPDVRPTAALGPQVELAEARSNAAKSIRQWRLRISNLPSLAFRRIVAWIERMKIEGATESSLPNLQHRKTTALRLGDRRERPFRLAMYISELTAQANIKLSPTEFIAGSLASALLLAFLSILLGTSYAIAAALSIFGFLLLLSSALISSAIRRRRFRAQMSPMLDLMVNGLRAGFSTLQAMEAVSRDLESPAGPELQRVVQEMQLGIPMERALDHLLNRMHVQNLDLMVSAINVQREVGGNLAEILDVISWTIREEKRIAREGSSLLKPRFIVLFSVVLLMMVAQWILFPSYFRHVWITPLGSLTMLVVYSVLSGIVIIGAFVSLSRRGIEKEMGGSIQSSGTRHYILNLGLGLTFLAVAALLGLPTPIVGWLGLLLLSLATPGLILALAVIAAFLIQLFPPIIQTLRVQTFYDSSEVISSLLFSLRNSITASETISILVVLALGVIGILLIVAIVANPAELRIGQSENFVEATMALDEPITLEDLELSQSFTARAIRPIGSYFANAIRALKPTAVMMRLRARLEMAGLLGINALWLFILAKALGAVLFGLLLLLNVELQSPAARLSLLAFVLLGFLLPDLWLSWKIDQRRRLFRRELPDALDLMVIAVEAGLGFDAAMAKVTEKWQSELAIEFGRVVLEIRHGDQRRDALRRMAIRVGIPEFVHFAAAVIQSDLLGVNMAKVLRIQSDTMRVARRQRFEGKARSLQIIGQLQLIALGSIAILWTASPVLTLLGF